MPCSLPLHLPWLAVRVGARLLLASTSEVYGDPEVHPQPESYRGSVNTIADCCPDAQVTVEGLNMWIMGC
jgi:hypothetical protein